MAKKNAYLARLQRQQDAACRFQRLFTIQQCKDMLLVMLHRHFGFGPERCKRAGEAYDRVFADYVDLCLTDARDDKEIIYTKAKLDQALQEALGDYFVPWEERYHV